MCMGGHGTLAICCGSFGIQCSWHKLGGHDRCPGCLGVYALTAAHTSRRLVMTTTCLSCPSACHIPNVALMQPRCTHYSSSLNAACAALCFLPAFTDTTAHEHAAPISIMKSRSLFISSEHNRYFHCSYSSCNALTIADAVALVLV